MHAAEEATGIRPPTTFDDEEVRLSAERRERTHRAATDAVEALKRHAFGHLADRT
jgi:hypothetical protein